MQVSSQFLYRLGGGAALIGGLLRVISSFIPYHEEVAWLEGLYSFVDICLLFGLAAIYLKYAERLGGIGVIAFVLSTTGIASIVGPDAIMFGINFYEIGAFTMITGLLFLSIQMLRNRVLLWASSLWILSFVFSVATILFSHSLLFIGAGISFGVAYMLSGIELMKQQSLGS